MAPRVPDLTCRDCGALLRPCPSCGVAICRCPAEKQPNDFFAGGSKLTWWRHWHFKRVA